jgi:hypothetical protein
MARRTRSDARLPRPLPAPAGPGRGTTGRRTRRRFPGRSGSAARSHDHAGVRGGRRRISSTRIPNAENGAHEGGEGLRERTTKSPIVIREPSSRGEGCGAGYASPSILFEVAAAVGEQVVQRLAAMVARHVGVQVLPDTLDAVCVGQYGGRKCRTMRPPSAASVFCVRCAEWMT